ncbi:MAG: HAMP domain-containing histidine kinase [Elusimicrobia bacterium]|nr:HAMP domain-containing histidine kinase [Elusimicrobiota bacterium]
MTVRWKYTLMTAALMAALVASVAALTARAQRQALEAQARERLDALMTGVARVAEESVASQDRFMLVSYILFLQRERPELKLAEVTRHGHTARVGADGPGLRYVERLVGGSPARYTITAPPSPDGRPRAQVEADASGVAVRVAGDARVELQEPAGEEEVRLRLGFSGELLDRETDRAVSSLVRRTLGIAAGFLGLGVLVSAVVGHRLAQPLAALAAAADAVGQGRLDVQVADGGRRDEVGAVARRFNAMTGRLRELVAFREDLLHTLTHELNTPLAGLRGTLELWRDRRPPEDPREYRESVGLMVAAVGRMEESLGSALSLFRGEREAAGAASLLWLNELLAEVRGLFAPVAEAKAVRLEVSAEVASLIADPELVRRIASNLVSNAVKYTPAGGRVWVDVADAGNAVHLVVSDTGHGISAEDLPHLFTKFFRAGDGGERRRIPGTGLGLSIVKRAVDALGGRVWVESRRGQGSRFHALLPKSPSLPLSPEGV